MTALLTDNLPLLAGAPNGIQKLRELILELAVRGKLVGLESDFRKLRLGEVGVWGSGGTPAKTNQKYYGGEIPWLVIGDLNDGIVSSAATHITRAGLENSSARIVPAGAVLIAMYGSIGKLGVAGFECATNQAIAHCQPNEDIISGGYLFILLKAIRPSLINQGQGLAQQNISQKILKSMEVAVPRLKDQGRIVTKVDELMALCDRLEARQADAASAHARLVQALLDSLTQASDADDFAANWQRLAEHFHSLFTSESSIDALKQTLLQLAVMGKLVAQDSSDEPASELLKRIGEEKARLVKEDGLRTTARDDVPEDEHYLAVPRGWAYCRLGNLARFIDYRGKTPTKTQAGIPLITAKNVRPGFISREPQEFIATVDYEAWMTRGFPRIGDMLFTTEAPMGNVALIDISEKFALAQRVICFQLHELLIGPFLKLAIMSSAFQKQLLDASTGMTATGIKASRLKEIPVPLPPLAEQHRIVAKLDQLMTLCDQLKTRLTAARQLHERLAGALVEQAVA